MKKWLKIMLVILAVSIGALSFLIFFYPDDKLDDLSSLIPTIQNVATEDNAYYLVEEALKNYQEPKYRESELLFFLTDGETGTKNTENPNIITDQDVLDFLELEKVSIESLEQASNLNAYKNPLEDKYSDLSIGGYIRDYSYTTKIKALYIKGLYELKQNNTQGIETIIKAIELASKIHNGSISIMDYLISNNVIQEGAKIINYVSINKDLVPDEIILQISALQKTDWQNYINATKFEFQTQKSTLENEILKTLTGWKKIANNKFNLRKNKTINELAYHMSNIIKMAERKECGDYEEFMKTYNNMSNRNPWTFLLKENGIGQIYIMSMMPSGVNQGLCEDFSLKIESTPKVGRVTFKNY